jgi:hypothetical protein
MTVSGNLASGSASLYDGNGYSATVNKSDANHYNANMTVNGRYYSVQMERYTGQLNVYGDVSMNFTGDNNYYTASGVSISLNGTSSTISGNGISMSGDLNGFSGTIYPQDVNDSYAMTAIVSAFVLQNPQ